MSEDAPLPREHEFQAPSEAELRRLYDEEEIERSMSLFSAYVTEIRLSTGVTSARSTESHIVDELDTATGIPSIPRPVDRSLSEHIAYDYLLPHLPPGAGVSPAFTLKRLSLTAQRLYVALFPPYKAFLSDFAQLALWKDHWRSLRHCIMFWFLWFHDLLLPALVFRIVFGLFRRRLLNYPTLQELQERRQETAQALKFWEAVQQRISATTLGPIELWHLFKLYKSEKESKTEPGSKDAITTIRPVEIDEEETLKRDMLYALNELADLHERIKNIFTWRRPDVSRRYLLFFIFVGFMALVLPAQYVAKLIYWFGGVLFWHVTPVVAALPRGDRTRQVPLFHAPTDADYAMELIAKRIATGHDGGITLPRKQTHRGSNPSASTDANSQEDWSSEQDGTSRKKWGERVAHCMSFLEESKQFLSANPFVPDSSQPPFLAQHASCPGLITLSPSILFFTPLTAIHAKLVIPCDRLRSVRRSGLVKGITITWAPEGLIGREEREEKFHWVRNRDELFARLVGSDGRRWLTL
ncbi:hypothetical protein L210DRAFT_962985 [Boletus edulis BED1]|uniref:Uncharacterized protein n=1 Tax=Boletus edulis BED1 TaxID=1328754 RepID=A0AAD4C237_BOLED|nr:hypothetical protein L210DRAFT_962985 [Boletus edulis BED1]